MRVRREEETRRSGSFPAVNREALQAAGAAVGAAFPWVDALYLFGSRSRGTDHAGSDVDVAALPSSNEPPGDRLQAEAEVARFVEDRLGVPVDVVMIRRALSPGILFDIFSLETILYARDWERAHRLACQARAEYRELLPRMDRAFVRLRRQIEERADALNGSRAGTAASAQ